MKQYFPFTDYDFYAYLTSGLALLFALDYAGTGGSIMQRDEWSFVETVLAVSIAYIAGQFVASLSSPLLEHGFARHFLYPPVAVLLALSEPRWRERLLGRLVGRYYEPFKPNVRKAIIERAATALKVESSEIRDPEEVFQVAFPAARAVEDTRNRMDDFRNQYGFNRNAALVAFVAAVAIALRAWLLSDSNAWIWAGLSLAVGFGLLVRFLKFYSAFAAEVLRAFAFQKS